MTEPAPKPRDCCNPASLACTNCHARGDFRIQVYLADEISLTRRAHAIYEPGDPAHTWWVEHLELECGCHTHRTGSTAEHTWWSERCPNRCDKARTSWLQRRALHTRHHPGGACADFTDPDDQPHPDTTEHD
jgi:hypothetical protein